MRRLALVTLLLLAAGCRGALPRAMEEREAPGPQPGFGAESGDDTQDLAPSDPYAERAGTAEEEAADPAPALAFAAPREAPQRPRPALPARVALAYVAVRGRRIVEDGDALLRLEQAVSDAGLDRVSLLASLPLHPADVGADATADLEELAAVAHDLERDLVLVDARGEDGAGKVYVIHAASGTLVARLPRGARRPTAGPLDLYDRLALLVAELD